MSCSICVCLNQPFFQTLALGNMQQIYALINEALSRGCTELTDVSTLKKSMICVKDMQWFTVWVHLPRLWSLFMLSRGFCVVCVQGHRCIYSHSHILNCLFTCFPLKATYSFTSLMKWLSSLMVGINKILNLNM